MVFRNIDLSFFVFTIICIVFTFFWFYEYKHKGWRFAVRYICIFISAILVIATNFIEIRQILPYDLKNKNLLYFAFGFLFLQIIVDLVIAIKQFINKKYK